MSVQRDPAQQSTDAVSAVMPAGPRSRRRSPFVVGLSQQLSAPRDFLTHDLSATPLFVIRQADGALKGFLNVCRHRGVRVVGELFGNQRSFTCPYHGWTYGADGTLKGIPFRQAFEDVDRDERGLVELAVEERHALVWVSPVPGISVDAAAYVERNGDDRIEALKLASRRVSRSACVVADRPVEEVVAAVTANADADTNSRTVQIDATTLVVPVEDALVLLSGFPTYPDPSGALLSVLLLEHRDAPASNLDKLWQRLAERWRLELGATSLAPAAD
jgi:nitrite reductase/ring-hydroxylating ferredoxin subunit